MPAEDARGARRHPSTVSLAAPVKGHSVVALGVDGFGQSGDIADLSAAYAIDAEAILGAAAWLYVRRGGFGGR